MRSLVQFAAGVVCAVSLAGIPGCVGVATAASTGSADLWQARNGAASSPTDPVDWVKGNAGAANSHFVEGHSVPYRLVLTGLSEGHHNLVLEWDVKQKGRQAIDYLSHFDRLQPHNQFGAHATAEAIRPLDGLPGPFGSPGAFPIPAPSSAGSPVPGQPTDSFNRLPEGERVVTIWNGTITNLTYLQEGDLNADSAMTRLSVDFLATNTTVVIAWGGHIASRLEWGPGRSAADISGSPYHMRIIALDGAGGNQDRSLQAEAVISPPTCLIFGPGLSCPGAIVTYRAATDGTNAVPSYFWSLTNNSSGAAILGAAAGSEVQVQADRGGAFTLQVVISANSGRSACVQDVIVPTSATSTPLADQSVCPGSTVSFSTSPQGTGPFTFAWRRDGVLIAEATNNLLLLPNVTAGDAGRYCVEVWGTCGSATNCANLAVFPPPIILCPPDLMVECWRDVPPPDPRGVEATTESSGVEVTHGGDVVNTNGCDIMITRTYLAADACGSVSACSQKITVVDTTAPTLTCAPARTVEYGNAWTFDEPTATDVCGNSQISVSVVDTATNAGTSTLYRATRTWQAVDACGNSATCSQTVTLADTTPPLIVCSSNLARLCEGSPGAAVPFAVSTSDVCDPDVGVVCVPPSGAMFSLGVNPVHCRATDFSGNFSECSFTVTVLDLAPPQIRCPADRVVAEDPPGSGHAAVSFVAPTATDNCDADPAVVCSIASGALLPVGDSRITCTASDASGNSDTCSFTVKVVPRTIIASSTADSGPGTLRNALLDANAAPGSNVIAFAFPGGPPYVIHLLSPLPPIADAVLIDGWSQLEFQGEPVIELDGTNAFAGGGNAPPAPDGAIGLLVSTGNSTVRGLVLNGFVVGLRLEGAGGNRIEGNLIGTDPTGRQAAGNSGDGIQIASPDNVIGGATPAARNIIAANRGRGILLETASATNNVVQGNFVGISGDGVTPLGNGRDGIAFRDGAANNRIGPDNIVAHNGGAGVLLEPTGGAGNAIRQNLIRSNSGLGIDLSDDGVTANDVGDADAGPNNLLNFPVLSVATTFGGTTKINGVLAGAVATAFQVDFFLNAAPDSSGSGEGGVYLGSATVQTDTNGTGDFLVELPAAVVPDQFITATATDPDNNTSEFSPAVWVGSPPFIVVQPVGTNLPPGTPVTFCVTAGGSAPLSYQWRHNGANISDATNACYTILSAALADGGSYSVVVANTLDAVLSEGAVLTLELPPIPAGDNFVDRVLLVRADGVAGGSNLGATREPGEPNHFGKAGGKSVWYRWVAPATGIARFATTGSTFDTLLAVYEGASVNSVLPVGSDEDRGGFFTSDVRFNAYGGTEYAIAVDGFGGQEGNFVFSWSLQPTNRLLPVIVTHPESRTVAPGVSGTFSVLAIAGCLDGHHDCRHPDKDHHPQHPEDQARLTYQWRFNGRAISGATNITLTVTNVQQSDLGSYTAQVLDGAVGVESLPASLQINLTGGLVQNAQATDKFLDAAYAPEPLRLGGQSAATFPAPLDGMAVMAAPAALARGYTGTQVFSTAGSSTELGEEPICGVVGGASQWFSLVPEEPGLLYVNTDGSSYNTVMAVFARSATNANVLQMLGCDNNGGLDGRDSALTVPVEGGKTNFIVVDGVNGATGTLQLNYSLVTPAILISLGKTAAGNNRLRLTGHEDMRFTVQASSNLLNWASLLTTNSVSELFDFVDRGSSNLPVRYYRALMLP